MLIPPSAVAYSRGSTYTSAGREEEVVEELAARLGHTKVYKGKEDDLRIGKQVLEVKHGLVYSSCEYFDIITVYICVETEP